MEGLVGFLIGLIVATIVWFFVLKNNRKKIQSWLDAPEIFFDNLQEDVGQLSAEAQQKLNDVIAELKSKKRR